MFLSILFLLNFSDALRIDPNLEWFFTYLLGIIQIEYNLEGKWLLYLKGLRKSTENEAK